MTLNLYTVKDKVSEEFSTPFSAKNDAVAIRKFKSMMTQGLNQEDYEMYPCGTFSTETGKVSLIQSSEFQAMKIYEEVSNETV